jgi:hypothetical protein
MSSPIFDPDPPRPKWRKRRRKWYVKRWHALRDWALALGWKGRSVAAAAVLAFLVLLYFNPFDDSAIPVIDADIAGREKIDCLLPGQREFRQLCTIETASRREGISLIVRAPDGEFRRLLMQKDGRGIIAADGAEGLKVKPAGPGSIEVTTGDIVWRLPRKVEG